MGWRENILYFSIALWELVLYRLSASMCDGLMLAWRMPRQPRRASDVVTRAPKT